MSRRIRVAKRHEKCGSFFLNRASALGGPLLHSSAMMDRQELEGIIATLRRTNDALETEFATLRSDHAALAESTRVMMADREKMRERIAELESVNQRLTDMLWGRRSERRPASKSPPLNFGDDPVVDGGQEQSAEVIEAEQTARTALDAAKLQELQARREARRTKREAQRSREGFPAHLERRVRTVDLSEEDKQGLKQIGVKVTERLRFEKPHVYVEQIQRPQYVKVDEPEQGVQSAPPPPAIVEGCKYDFSVIAAIVAMKFAFHMTTYREQDFFGQSGWRPSRSTCNDLINYGVDCIDPLFAQMWARLLSQPILLGDATELTVLLHDELDEAEQKALENRRQRRRGGPANSAPVKFEGSAKSYAWLYTGLDAPRELSPELDDEHPPPQRPPPDFSQPCWNYAPYNLFHWSLTQENSVIDGHLQDFQGIFVGDAAGVNARLAARSSERIRHQSCNSHARREFVKAQANDTILAAEMFSFFRQLYGVEYRGAQLTVAERLALRQREATPIWSRMQAWLERPDVKNVLPKSDIAQAIGYLRNQWQALRLYLTNGEIPFDNNHSERVIRPLTIGRKNWVFLGSTFAAPGRMKLFSVVSSAQRHCLSIQHYLEDIFLQLSQAAQHRPEELAIGSPLLMSLLPDRWGALHPQYVHGDRLVERRMVAENKLYYRLQAGLAGNHPYAAPVVH